LEIPAPWKLFETQPDVTVRPESVFVVPFRRAKTRTALLPLTLKSCIPGPLIAVLSAISGSGDDSVMVPFIVIAMMSSPEAAFALRIASLREPGPESAVEETTNVAD